MPRISIAWNSALYEFSSLMNIVFFSWRSTIWCDGEIETMRTVITVSHTHLLSQCGRAGRSNYINDNDGNNSWLLRLTNQCIIVTPLHKFDTSPRHDLPLSAWILARTNRFPNCNYQADPVCLPIVLLTQTTSTTTLPSTRRNRKSSQLNNRFLPVFLKQYTAILLSVSKWILMGFLSQLIYL